jgi:predicted transcriptional regulator
VLKLQALHPRHRDLRFVLGELEAVVLRQLWETDKPVSVRDFQAMISRRRPVAVTTVATTLDRLYRKGLVSRELVREGGPHYLYRARMTEGEFRHAVVDGVMEALLESFNDVTVAYLAEKIGSRKPEDVRILSKYLNRLRRKRFKDSNVHGGISSQGLTRARNLNGKRGLSMILDRQPDLVTGTQTLREMKKHEGS